MVLGSVYKSIGRIGGFAYILFLKNTEHAEIQALQKNINFRDIYKNINNPKYLASAIEQNQGRQNERVYDCHFILSKTQTHRYILALGKKCVVVTVIKIKRKLQRQFEKGKKKRGGR